MREVDFVREVVRKAQSYCASCSHRENSVINNCCTDLQVSLGVVLGKKYLIKQFFDFSVMCTYDEVLLFKDSAAAASLKKFSLNGYSKGL